MGGRTLAVKKLIGICDVAQESSNVQLAAISALGRAGGILATRKLIAIYDVSVKGSARQLAAIQALGEAARSEIDVNT